MQWCCRNCTCNGLLQDIPCNILLLLLLLRLRLRLLPALRAAAARAATMSTRCG
jgi:hypothetical protein